jgi:hypothetical protein
VHYLLVQPRFPIPAKSQNHKSFLPVGLLKLASWLRSEGHTVELARGNVEAGQAPDAVFITSLFTYWSGMVWDSVRFYKETYPDAPVTVGGIYASLAPEHCALSGCDSVYVGVHQEAERHPPAYDLVDSDFQIVHASRGCIRRCEFCGTYRIEPRYEHKKTVLPEIVKPHLVFYDNNLLANPDIETILTELSDARHDGRRVTAECQSGFDGRLLTPRLAQLLKSARFRNPRIAWDGPLDDADLVRAQVETLRTAGYSAKDISVFMIFNYDISPKEMVEKAETCFGWGVQVADCRYRPLDRWVDGYLPMRKFQARGEYYMHEGWEDPDIRGFRRRVRENNICLRYEIPRAQYDRRLEGLRGEDMLELSRSLGLTVGQLTRDDLNLLNRAWLRSQPAPVSVAASGP